MEIPKKHCIVFNDNQEIKRRTSGAYRFAHQLENMGWQVTVVDWISSWSESQLTEYLDSLVGDNTVLFGISYTWMKANYVLHLTNTLRARYPGRKYIAGGQQFYQKNIGCDVMMFGYAEKALTDTLAWMFDGGEQPRGQRPVQLGGGFLIDCNLTYPAMALGDYGIRYRPDDYIQPFELLTVELSRGCRFQCKYCNYAFLGIKEDTSTAASTLRAELMLNWERWGTTNYIIADDTLNDRDSKLEMLAEVVESLPFEPNFASFIRIDLVVSKPKQMELLSRARVWAHFYGVETFHPGAGKAVSKGMHPDKIKQGLLDMRKHMMSKLGLYRGTLGMIAGLPTEPPPSWQASEDWLQTNWSDNGWQWWPLEISLDTLTATTSIFSKEWKKHGYREITDADRNEKVMKLYDRDTTGVQHKFDTKSLMWTSDWADIGQATEFVYNINNGKYYKERKVTANFHILNHWDDFEDKAQLLKLTDTESSAYVNNGVQHQKIILPYIDSKLKDARLISMFKLNSLFAKLKREKLLESNI
tara:strand:- start:4372 stop:5958 length:1587 start_codon:yes stop_codon:yes gene_type:complete